MFLTKYQKDLPEQCALKDPFDSHARRKTPVNLFPPAFRSVTWCKKLYKRTESHEKSTTFDEKQI